MRHAMMISVCATAKSALPCERVPNRRRKRRNCTEI
jgi:hypothetical protein